MWKYELSHNLMDALSNIINAGQITGNLK